ncbi:putative WD repeat-containing protein C3H5.08c [Silene latifolia]|uniref:putative WD repeat-containing protein C3H5.08c n=1 Tax=Silene latifolia TaxID=37657 RepID=UPI003D7859E7
MASCCYTDKEKFFDAAEEISSESDSASEDSGDIIIKSKIGQVGNNINDISNLEYDFWTGNPRSIDERRDEFTRKTGFVIERCLTAREGPNHDCIIPTANNFQHNTQMGDSNGRRDNVHQEENNPLLSLQHPNGRRDNVHQEKLPGRLDEESVDTVIAIEDYDKLPRTFDSKNLVPDIVEREGETKEDDYEKVVDIIKEQQVGKKGWLKRFSFKAAKDKLCENKVYNYSQVFGCSNQKVRVRSHKKWSKEMSSLYRKQDFLAHNGPILAMKFSHDGRHLASGGEDGSLSIWEVTEDDKSTDFDLINFIPSLYFLVNGTSSLASFLKVKEDGSVINNKLRKSSDSSIMVPRKCFRILETPIHEFHGHESDILDISWSRKGHLLSSSIDKTVRLWQLGCGECLETFPHNDYVTCAQFNPVDDNYFISGSIDGIIRIWEVFSCQVVHWLDIKEIVTAICYKPDGKSGIVGSITGSCSFFDIKDDSLRHHLVLSLQSKKTFTCKRITGFQFSPVNPKEVVVSSADSQIRVLRGADVICKLRGSLPPLIDRKRQIFASFTSDGKHVISATEESKIYVWNHHEKERWEQGKSKNIWSCESFISDNAVIAIPWYGITPCQHNNQPDNDNDNDDTDPEYKTRYMCSSIDNNGSSRVRPSIGNIDHDFLRNVCESVLSGSHLWGLVIVTAGKDGRIQVYQNYGYPKPKPRSLKSSFSFSSFRKQPPAPSQNSNNSPSSSSRDSLQSL